jgi:predicted MFS family arabinose efflux permease
MMAMFLFLTLYFQDVLGYSPLKSGFSFLPFSLMVITMATVSSKLLPRVGPRPLMVTGLFSASIGLYLLSNIEVHSSYLTHVLPSCFLVAGGMGLSFVAFSSTALYGVKDHDAGVASATLNAAQQVGGALGLSLLYTVAHSASVNYVKNVAANLPVPPTAGTLPLAVKNAAEVHGFQVGFLGGSIGLFLAMIVAATFITKDAGKMNAAEELVAAGF